jgi:hypothetical protein
MKLRLSRARAVYRRVLLNPGGLVPLEEYQIVKSELVDPAIGGFTHLPERDFHLVEHSPGQYARMVEGGLYDIERNKTTWTPFSPVFVPDDANFIVSEEVISPDGWFGDGSDGTFILNGVQGSAPNGSFTKTGASEYTQARDAFYQDFTIDFGITYKPAGYRTFVKGTFTLNGTIATIGGNGGNGSAGGNGSLVSSAGSAAGPGGAAGTNTSDAYLGGGGNGGSGGNGTDGAGWGTDPGIPVSGYLGAGQSNPGNQGSAITNGIGVVGGAGQASGQGGNSGFSGGGILASNTRTAPAFTPYELSLPGGGPFHYGQIKELFTVYLGRVFGLDAQANVFTAPNHVQNVRSQGQQSGGGGGGGAGAGSTPEETGRGGGGGGGGGSGAAGNHLWLWSYRITGVGSITASGGNGGNGGIGGNGAASHATNAGGGGGGGGAGGNGGAGGVVFLGTVYLGSGIQLFANGGIKGFGGVPGAGAGLGAPGVVGNNGLDGAVGFTRIYYFV